MKPNLHPLMRAVQAAVPLLCTSLAACGGGGDDDSAIAYDCSVFPPAATSPYTLPWVVGQTFSALPHAARETGPQRYAIDVLMPIGTDVLAMRAGVVTQVEEQFIDGDRLASHSNHIFVLHDDSTVARYVHLTNMGSLVEVGDTVQQGDHIGRSGNTGQSSDPHLHFDVFTNCPAGPGFDSSNCPTLPLNFRNAQVAGSGGQSDLSCGLRRGVSYTALP